ncbi:hypothetical protein, partial [Escherichia coli]|uniref:hypothetical protein n=1 Tax=Escherichia coli TaxID=562 RepID=UPI001A7E07E6
ASTIFGVHYSLRNFRICQTVLRRRLRRDLFFTDSNDACQYIINMRIVSVTDALLRKKTASTDFRWGGAGSKG